MDWYIKHVRSKINSCLVGTKWTCKLQPTFVDDGTMSDVLSFSNQFISDVCKTAYETWKVPFVVDGYTIWFGKPSKEILDNENKPYIFKFGQGVGLKTMIAHQRIIRSLLVLLDMVATLIFRMAIL